MRKSRVTEYGDISAFSGKPKECDHHLIFGRGLRDLAEEDGLFIPLTDAEHDMSSPLHQIHDNPPAEKLSKIAGQLAFEKNYYRDLLEKYVELDGDIAREKFRQRYGTSYL